MANTYVNKVQLADGTTLIDISSDTVTADKILNGYTAHSASGANITGNIGSATATISGSNQVAPTVNVTGTNCVLGSTNNGIKIKATGGGGAAASVTATTGTAGYAASQAELGSDTIFSAQTTIFTELYISGVTLEAPSSGTRSFAITVPSGNSTTTFTFNVDSGGNVYVTES